jgi:peptide/nickel transport system substrate-binding protein
MNTDFVPAPGLAKAWQISEDGLTYTFDLVQNARFHDGTPVNAEAFVYNFDRIKNPDTGSPRASELSFVDSYEATGEYTFVARLSQPYAAFLPALASWSGMIVSPTAVEQYGEDFTEHLIGAGPFKVVDHIRDDRVLMVRNDDYFREGLPYLDQVIVRPFVDGESRVINLKSGALDMIYTIPGKDLADLQTYPGVIVASVPGLGYSSMYMNTESTALSNPYLRQSLNYCVDRDIIINTVFANGGAVAAYSPFSPATFVTDTDDVAIPKRDPEKVRELLALGGAPNGFSFDVLFAADEQNTRIVTLVQAMCAEFGIQINAQQTEFGQILARAGEGNYQAAWISLTPRNDPDLSAFPWFTSDSTNFGRINNAVIDDLLTRARAVSDISERRELYRAAADEMLLEMPYLFLYHSAEIKAYRDRVQGYAHIADGMMRFESVWVND